MNKLNAFKFATRLVVGIGTTTVSNSIIRNNVTPSNPVEAVSVAVASVVIGSMASEATKSHTNRKIDEYVELWKSSKSTDEDPVTA
jgi:hypothetical protein